MNIEQLIPALNGAATLAELEAALSLVHIDYDALRAGMDTLDGREYPWTEYLQALQDAGVPAGAADAYYAAMARWNALRNETPEQRAIREAFDDARHLLDTLGKQHPKTMDAVIRAIELQDPGCFDRMARECGINLPNPDFCDDNGQKLYSSHAIAEAVGVPHDKVLADIEAMGNIGLTAPAGAVHRLQ